MNTPRPRDLVSALRPRRSFLAGAGMLGAATALAACTGDSPSPSSPTVQGPTATPLPDVAWDRADHANVPDGGTLRLAVRRLPENWNSHHRAGAVSELDLLRAPLGLGAEITAQGTDPHPDYIESAQVTAEQPQTVSFRYNPAAVWEDGSPITVADLISRWRANNGSDPQFEVASTVGWDQIHSIEQTDDEFTGQMVFTSPFADWVTVLHPDVPASVTSTPQAFNQAHASTPTPSRGPFRVDSIDEGTGMVAMVRNENWWGRAPRLERIVVSALDPSQAPQAFVSGHLDVLEVSTAQQLELVRGRRDATIRRAGGTSWTHLTLNVEGPEARLADPVVREAIARGIDREAIARAALQPLGAPVVLMDNLVHLPGHDGYADSFGSLAHDPEAAASLLEEAGWRMEGQRRVRDGEALAIVLVVPAQSPSLAERASLVQADLSGLGFEVEVREVPAETFFAEHLAQGAFDATTFAWAATRFPGTSTAAIAYPLDSGQNFTGMADERIGPVLEEMAAAQELSERTRLANEFSAILAETFTVIPLFVMPEVWAVREGVLNLGPSTVERMDWTAVGLRR